MIFVEYCRLIRTAFRKRPAKPLCSFPSLSKSWPSFNMVWSAIGSSWNGGLHVPERNRPVKPSTQVLIDLEGCLQKQPLRLCQTKQWWFGSSSIQTLWTSLNRATQLRTLLLHCFFIAGAFYPSRPRRMVTHPQFSKGLAIVLGDRVNAAQFGQADWFMFQCNPLNPAGCWWWLTTIHKNSSCLGISWQFVIYSSHNLLPTVTGKGIHPNSSGITWRPTSSRGVGLWVVLGWLLPGESCNNTRIARLASCTKAVRLPLLDCNIW